MANQPLKRYDTGTSSWVGVASGSVSDGTTELGVNDISQYSIRRQALINGNFDIWQRGTSFSDAPALGIYTADRWVINVNAAGGTLPTTIVRSRQNITPGDIDGATYFYRLSPNGAGSSFGTTAEYSLRQMIENGTRLLAGNGKQITVSFWARSSIASKKIGLRLFQGYGSGGSPSSAEILNGNKWTLSSTWTKYTYTFSTNTLVSKTFGTNNDDVLGLDIFVMWGSSSATGVGDTVAETFRGSGNIDIAQVQVNSGSTAIPFQPRTYAEELLLCQRYYFKSFGDVGITGSVSNVATSTFILTGGRPFPVTMRTTPTFGLSYAGVQNQVRRQSDNATISVTGNSYQGGPNGLFYMTFTGTPFTAGTGYDYDIAADAEF